MDISNIFRTFIVNTVFANPPPDCPPDRTVQPCPNKCKSSDFDKPPPSKTCRKGSPRTPQDGTKTGVGDATKSGVGDGTKAGVSDGKKTCLGGGTKSGVAGGTKTGVAGGTKTGVAGGTKTGVGDGTKPGAGGIGGAIGGDIGGGTKSGVGDGTRTGVGDGTRTGVGDGMGMGLGVGEGMRTGVDDGTRPGAGDGTRPGADDGTKMGAGDISKMRPGDGSKARGGDVTKTGAGDLGKVGAGLSGSRTEQSAQSVLADQNEFALPVGATNPGLLRHIHNAARYRLPQCFEGAGVTVQQKSENNWIVGHSMMFSSVSPGGYKLLLSYMNKDKPTGLPYFVMESAPGGQMSCEVRVGPTYGTRATVMAQVADAEFRSFESIIDFFFSSSTASVIAVNREFIALHFLQALTDKLSMGVEVVSQGNCTEMSSASGAARWATDDFALSGTLGNRGLDLCFARAVRPFLTVAALLEVGFAIRRAVATLAYEWRADDWTFRGSADSDGLIGATLQRALGGKRAQLAGAISALYNHPNEKFRLGFGVTASIV